MGYEVTSISPVGEPKKATRDSAQEAVALAIQWVNQQHKNVQMTDLTTGQLYRDQTLIDIHREIEGRP